MLPLPTWAEAADPTFGKQVLIKLLRNLVQETTQKKALSTKAKLLHLVESTSQRRTLTLAPVSTMKTIRLGRMLPLPTWAEAPDPTCGKLVLTTPLPSPVLETTTAHLLSEAKERQPPSVASTSLRRTTTPALANTMTN